MLTQQIEAIGEIETIRLHVLVDEKIAKRSRRVKHNQELLHFTTGRIKGSAVGLHEILEQQHIDIYHCLNQGMSVPSAERTRVVASMSHDLPRTHPQYCPAEYGALYEQRMRQLQGDGAYYTTTSQVLKEALMTAYHIQSHKIQVVRPFVNRFYRPISPMISRTYIGQKYGLQKGYLLGVMDSYESHQIIPLLESFKCLRVKCSYLKLVLLLYIAPMYQVYYKEIMRQIARLELGRWVMVVTQFTAEDQRHFYNDAQYLVDFSQGNKVNMSLLEAASCGCRVLVQDTPLHRELLGDYGDYIEDVKELSLCQSWLEQTPQDISKRVWQAADREAEKQKLLESYLKCYE